MAKFFKVRIAEIDIGSRERKDFGDIESLKLSMHSEGQLQPIIVEKIKDDNYLLLGGERRLRAAIELGWLEMDASLKEDLDEIDRVEIEAAENFHRKDFTWQEKSSIIERLHLLKVEKLGAAISGRYSTGWGVRDTAKVLNISVGTVQENLDLAQGLKQYPELANELSARHAKAKHRVFKLKGAKLGISTESLRASIQEAFQLKDFLQSHEEVPAGSVSLLITDVTGQSYHVLPKLQRVLAMTGEAYLFCNHSEQYHIISKLKELGMVVDQTPFILHYRSEDLHVPFIWCSPNMANPPVGLPHLVSFNREFNCIHTRDKPKELLHRLILANKDKVQLIFDPFAYGGSTVLAGLQLNYSVTGWCQLPAIYEKALDRLVEERK